MKLNRNQAAPRVKDRKPLSRSRSNTPTISITTIRSDRYSTTIRLPAEHFQMETGARVDHEGVPKDSTAFFTKNGVIPWNVTSRANSCPSSALCCPFFSHRSVGHRTLRRRQRSAITSWPAIRSSISSASEPRVRIRAERASIPRGRGRAPRGIDARSARIRTRGSDAELIDERIAGQLVIAERCRRRSVLCPTDRCEKKGQQSADDGHELAREVTFHGITPFFVKNAVESLGTPSWSTRAPVSIWKCSAGKRIV